MSGLMVFFMLVTLFLMPSLGHAAELEFKEDAVGNQGRGAAVYSLDFQARRDKLANSFLSDKLKASLRDSLKAQQNDLRLTDFSDPLGLLIFERMAPQVKVPLCWDLFKEGKEIGCIIATYHALSHYPSVVHERICTSQIMMTENNVQNFASFLRELGYFIDEPSEALWTEELSPKIRNYLESVISIFFQSRGLQGIETHQLTPRGALLCFDQAHYRGIDSKFLYPDKQIIGLEDETQHIKQIKKQLEEDQENNGKQFGLEGSISPAFLEQYLSSIFLQHGSFLRICAQSPVIYDYCEGRVNQLADPATIARNTVWADNLPRRFEQIAINFRTQHPECLHLPTEGILNIVKPVILVGAAHTVDINGWYEGSFLSQLKGYELKKWVLPHEFNVSFPMGVLF